MSNSTLFVEMFPVVAGALPKLHAYRPTDPAAATPRTANTLARQFGGRWAWADGLVLTDTPPKKSDFKPEDAHLEKVSRYQPSPLAQAGYLIEALVPPLADQLTQALQTPLQVNFRPLQEPTFKAWDVDGAPAVSIGMVQRLIYRQDLAEYAATIPNQKGLVGMTVISRTPWVNGRLLTGVVVGVSGTVGERRDDLERFARTDDARKRLQRAPDSEPAVTVRTFYGDYVFAAHTLHIVLGAKDYARLRIDPDAARQASYQNITERARAVAAASGVLKEAGYIGESYKASTVPDQFMTAADLGFGAQITLGDGQPRPYAPRRLWGELGKFGMFRAPEVERPVRIGIVNALGDAPPNNFEKQLIAALQAINVPVANVQSVLTSGLTPDEAAAAFAQLNQPDAVIVFIPGSEPTPYTSADDWAAFINIKREVIDAQHPSICVFERDMSRRDAPQETALGFALAVGYTPFALGAPLPYADVVVGMTVVRGEPDAFVNVAYHANGVLVGYIICKGKLDPAVLYPEPFFGGTRTVLQHTDALTDDELAALDAHAAALNMTLHRLDVSTAANPRLYVFTGRGVRQSPTGSVFKLADDRALLISALPAHPAAPPNPLLVQTDATIAAPDALRTVLEMNLLHPQAKKPRLPVTLHYGERVRRLFAAGVMPPDDTGAMPFWL